MVLGWFPRGFAGLVPRRCSGGQRVFAVRFCLWCGEGEQSCHAPFPFHASVARSLWNKTVQMERQKCCRVMSVELKWKMMNRRIHACGS